MTAFDPRTTLARPDLAAEELRGQLEAARYAAPQPHWVRVGRVPLFGKPDPNASWISELRYGDRFRVLESRGDWAFGQNLDDDYVGYAPMPVLGAGAPPPPTHRIAAPWTPVQLDANTKAPPAGMLTFFSAVSIKGEKGESGEFSELATGGYVRTAHLVRIDHLWTDIVFTAGCFLNTTPYVWGGRTPLGLDCSGLVQLVLNAAGLTCPRDSDQQEAAIGEAVPENASVNRGDLIFFKGHVAIATDATHVIHANAHFGMVTAEPLSALQARAGEQGRFRRLPR